MHCNLLQENRQRPTHTLTLSVAAAEYRKSCTRREGPQRLGLQSSYGLPAIAVMLKIPPSRKRNFSFGEAEGASSVYVMKSWASEDSAELITFRPDDTT